MRPYLSTLAVLDEAVTARYASADKPSPFFRMGRSYIINVSYVTSVNLANSVLVFDSEAVKPVVVTKNQLKSLRYFVATFYHLSAQP
ncbi:MAG: LytTR family transcriptional regulator DNA-binding domain-containing protein [Bacteroidales bacterium]|nr:LytTR family transcriptional regulator DNA-binding domain-containing protein [Bacteroidales bacterium]